jgi:Na+/H+ antiporter NhaC
MPTPACKIFVMNKSRTCAVAALLAMTFAVTRLDEESLFRAIWPAVVAIGSIILLHEAAIGLMLGVAAAALLLCAGDPIKALRLALEGHVFPAMQGSWRIGALVFTLILGSFAGILERSGGFEAMLRKALGTSSSGEKRLLFGAYGIGLLCFFDGLASSLLTGRIARPLADRAGVSRERLSWVVDSTGSPVACIAFISTWIATQLSLIEQGLKSAPFKVEPYAMFFSSVPANAYCLLTLLLVPLAIGLGYQPAAMRRFTPYTADGENRSAVELPSLASVIVPLAVLVSGILLSFPLLAGEIGAIFSVGGWTRAFSSETGPHALVLGSLAGWIAAMVCFPSKRRHEAAEAAVHGAGSLLPALVILIFAWSLGSMFEALGTTRHIAELFQQGIPVAWFPLVIFLLGSSMAFTTGSSWGTMGLLMPLALPALLSAAQAANLPPQETRQLAAMVIGAVFGGATLGDHCSPFSDTTIVSALASGCRTIDHVTSQLPFAAYAALASCAAYALMALGIHPALSTAAAAAGLILILGLLAKSRRHCHSQAG